MFTKILLPVDLNHTKSWTKALAKASGLAKAFDAELHLLSVVPDFGMTIVSDFFPEGFEKKSAFQSKDGTGVVCFRKCSKRHQC